MRLPSIEKRVVRLMEAIDKHAKTDLPKREDEYMRLIQSTIRPIVRKWCDRQDWQERDNECDI